MQTVVVPSAIRAQSDKRSHLFKLDVLRGLAILTVFFYHLFGATFGMDRLKWHGLFPDFHDVPTKQFYLFYPLTFGWAGVCLFFVLSGFVIHLSYLKTTNFRTRDFYWRRFWRIYPPYLVAILAFVVLSYPSYRSRLGLEQVLSHVLAIHNFHPAFYFGINGSFWSLAVEIQFYALFPLLVLLHKNTSMKWILLYSVGLSLAGCAVAARFTDWSRPDLPYYLWASTLILWPQWILGAYIAERYYQGKPALSLPRLSVPLLLFMFVGSTLFRPTSVLSSSIAALLCAILLDRYVRTEHQIRRWEVLIIPLGLCSYSFYLWHQPLLPYAVHWLHRLGAPRSPMFDLTLSAGIIFLGIYGISWGLYSSIEKWGVHTGKRLQFFTNNGRKAPGFSRRNEGRKKQPQEAPAFRHGE